MAKGRPKDPGAAKRGTGRKPPKAAPPAVIDAAPATVCGLEPPADLPELAHEAWQTCVSEMASNRQLRDADLILLKAYVEAVYIHAEASAKVHEFGVLVASPKGPIPNPMIRVQDNAARTIRLLADDLHDAGASLVMGIRDRLVKEIVK